MKECKSCKISKVLDEFHKQSASLDGHQSRCKECNKEQRKAYYQTARGRANNKASGKRWEERVKVNVMAYLSEHPCVDCGEADPVVLEFDHRDPSLKTMNISVMMRKGIGWQKILAEIEKCDIRCANCHRRRTAHQYGSYRLIENLDV